MKYKALLLMWCWLACTVAFAQDKPAFSLRPVSKELPKVDGNLRFSLVIKSGRATKLNELLSLEPSAGLVGATAGPVGEVGGSIEAGDSLTREVYIQYDAEKLPYNFQTVEVRLTNAQTQQTSGLTTLYVYFTPYGTVELWSQDDFDNQKRIWNESDNPKEPAKRKYVRREDIPVSDLTDEEWADDELQKSYISVEGLGYIIPTRHVEEVDEDDGTGPESNFRTWRGTISGNVRTLLRSGTQLPITGIRVTVMDQDYFGVGCTGWDDELAVTHTDNDGNFSVYVQSNQRYRGGLFGCAREGDDLELYLVIMARTASGDIRVCQRLFSKVRETTHSEGNPLRWYYSSNGQDVRFNDVDLTPSHIKPQLLHWANQSRRFANEELAAAGFSTPNTHGDPLKIYLYPFTQSRGGLFIPGGYKAAIVGIGGGAGSVLHPLIGVVTAAALALELTNDDCLYIGEGSEQNENLTYHEFGHYLMWKMQNEAWVNPLVGSFANHGSDYNGGNPKIAWTEGWADAFSAMADSYCFRYDLEAGTEGGGLNHENRTINGQFPEITVRTIRNAPDGPVLTHGFVSEMNTQTALFDLFDGTENFKLNGGIRSGGSRRSHLDVLNGIVNDEVELSLAEICRPILNRNSGGIFGFFSSRVIQNVTEYHRYLVESLDCERRAAVTRLFTYNRISSFDRPATDLLNSDAISENRNISIEQFTELTNRSWDFERDGATSFFFNALDVPVLNGSGRSFNLGSTNNFGSEALTDNLLVQNGATLYVNARRALRFNNGATPAAGLTFSAQLCGGTQVTLGGGGQMQLGTGSTNNTATVSVANRSLLDVRAGATLTVENGSVLVVPTGGTLVVRNGGTLVVNGNGQVRIEAGGYLCIENQAALRFGPSAQLRIDVNARPGTNPALQPALSPATAACSTDLALCVPQLVLTGSGSGPGAAFASRNEALRFDGDDDRVEIDNAPALNVAAGQPFTYEAYIRSNVIGTSSAPLQLILSKRNTNPLNFSGEGMMFGIWEDGRLWAQLSHRNLGFTHTVNYTLLDGQCHHVAMTRDANNLFRLYVDGNMVEEGTYAYAAASAGALRIGTDLYTPDEFNGDIGKVRMWNRGLSAQEIRANYLGAAYSGAEANLVANWDMDGLNGSAQLPGRTAANVINGTLGAGALAPAWVSVCNLSCRLNGQFRTASDGSAVVPAANGRSSGTFQPGRFQTADSLQAFRLREVTVYPNPFSSHATVVLSNATPGVLVSYCVRDLSGRVMQRQDNHPAIEPLRFGEALAPGVYFIQVTTRTFAKTVKFVKMEQKQE